MLNLDPGKLLVIGVVAIILLGPDRLPQVARQVGGAWRAFNEFRHRMETQVRDTMPDLPDTSEIARLARSPSALLNHLSNMASDEEPDGSFQPPDLSGEIAGTDAGADTNGTAPTAVETDAETDERAAPTPAPATPSTPAPIHVEHPPRVPKPSGVVVPGDPTLN
jgi:sec-independent protein translocase protein TatB